MVRLRTIIESKAAETAVDLAQKQYPRFESAWEGWTWRIARGPETAFKMPGYVDVYMFKSHSAFTEYGIPETVILYKVKDENSIEIIAVQLIKA